MGNRFFQKGKEPIRKRNIIRILLKLFVKNVDYILLLKNEKQKLIIKSLFIKNSLN
jgi:hypothetical protein